MADSVVPESVVAAVNVKSLAERWWTLAIRGVAAIVFGILTFVSPASGLYALVAIFAAFAIVDGVLNLVCAARSSRYGRRWGWLVFEGVISTAAGVVAIVLPILTAVALLTLVAAWAIITGIAEVAAAIRLRRELQGEWLLGLSGVLSIALGVLLVVFPTPGLLTLVIWIGAYAVVSGALVVVLALRLRAWNRAEHHAHA
jgi:uncharacterized membrane protein HdeD (DUF308 family)